MRWSMEDIKAAGIHIDANGKTTRVGTNGFKPEMIQAGSKTAYRSNKKSNKGTKEKYFIEFALIAAKVEYVKEFQFAPPRKFRADFAVIESKFLCEYEGVFSTEKSRHTTVFGYTKDCEKYNLATINGWRILRYTSANYKDIVRDLKLLL